MHWRLAVLVVLLSATLARPATLEKLTLEQMIQQSTEIVRGRVVGASVEQRGAILYTRFQVQVTERWKGEAKLVVEAAVPGGHSGRVRQTFPGTPSLQPGQEYILFLWTGRGGLTQIIGLSQGVFDLVLDEKGNPAASRAATTETLLDAAGQKLTDRPVRLSLSNLDRMIRTTLAEAR
jgi:hypothetical protein